MSKAKIILIVFLTIISISLVSVFLWQKPKLEALAKKYIETLTQDEDIPVLVKVERTNISLFPPQVEIINAQVTPKGELKKKVENIAIDFVSVQPSFIDLLIGKFWISELSIEGAAVNLKIDDAEDDSNSDPIEFNRLLQRIPISEISLNKIKLDLLLKNKFNITTSSLALKAYNKKSSLIVTIKEPELFVKDINKKSGIDFLIDSQLMLTKNTVSLSKLKLVKDKSFFLASGNTTFSNNFKNISEAQISTRIKSSFKKVDEWVNIFEDVSDLKIFKGEFKTDIDISKKTNANNYTLGVNGAFRSFQIEDVVLGDFDIEAQIPNKKEILIPKIALVLSGNNEAFIENAKVNIDEKTNFSADVIVDKAQLQSFLKASTIADIPVWVNVSGKVHCVGTYEKKLEVDCPGSVSAQKIKIQNGSRTKTIVEAEKVDITGTMKITEKFISYKAIAQMPTSKATSDGIISYKEGFNINYDSPVIDLDEIGPIADLKFKGKGSAKGVTKGNSKSATFSMDIKANNFEFEDYYFGSLQSKLGYRSGTLYLQSLKGDLESTRYNGHLNINLDKELITGDLQLPFSEWKIFNSRS